MDQFRPVDLLPAIIIEPVGFSSVPFNILNPKKKIEIFMAKNNGALEKVFGLPPLLIYYEVRHDVRFFPIIYII